MKRLSPYLLTGLFGLCAAAHAADSGKLLRASELRDKPFSDARVVAKLPAATAISISQRKGSWAQVTSREAQGWIKVLNIVSVSGKQGSLGLAEAGKVLTTGASGKASSTAVKGFDEEDLKKSEPAPAEVTYLETLGSSSVEAQSFARRAGLKSETVPFLPKAD